MSKFRAWYQGEMWHIDLLRYNSPLENEALELRYIKLRKGNQFTDELYVAEGPQKVEVVMMETIGIQDKDGKDMYKDDIVSYHLEGTKIIDGVQTPYVSEEKRKVIGICLHPKIEHEEGFSWLTETDYKVLGNIWEHPELKA